MELIKKLILELANYSQNYNKSPNPINLTDYKIKTQIISSLLEKGTIILPSSNRCFNNNVGSCYLNACLHLLNTIPEIRNIPRYSSVENEKTNSYLREVFDELNKDDKKR